MLLHRLPRRPEGGALMLLVTVVVWAILIELWRRYGLPHW